ncbi:lipocalin-like domain-containing protein [Anaeromicropila populeti]|uniref:Beta-xylosidase n=1 Tax=Anaeromicropila populeti TaxID=37658 RepID=A0A1I6K5W6_9FIRM|nr:glycoside hydrolase family 43 C-terminal domain-containing protein [Anaeromicropila populeti]SFR86577.1 Beta-xylosidase [Anaeromicropila populeti]
MKPKYYKVISVILSIVLVMGPFQGWGSSKTILADNEKAAVKNGIKLTEEEVNTLTSESLQVRTSVHDPSITVDQDGNYYVFGSHMGVSSSKDLMNWSNVTSESTTSTLFADANGKSVSYADAFKDNAYKGQVVIKSREGNTYQVDFGDYDAAAWISDNTVAGNMWAPDVIYNETMGKWCMYLSLNGAKWNSAIILLTADRVEGPYIYQGPVLFSGFSTQASTKSYKNTDLELVIGEVDQLPEKYQKISNSSWGTYWPHAIDPCVFYDDNGKLWMSYGSWSGGIYVLELDEATGFRDYTISYGDDFEQKGAGVTKDSYFGKKIAGGYYVSGEGSYIEKIGEYYFLFMSYGFYSPEGGYNMRVFRSSTPDGSYVDVNGTSAIFNKYIMNYSSTNADDNRGLKLMGNYKWNTMGKAEIAQGHNSAFVDKDGKAYVVYHTKFNDGSAGHEVRVHQLFSNEDGWIVAAPYEYSGETISKTGYSKEDITGNYEMILHKFQVDYANLEYVEPVAITLNADGTITGTYTGSWNVNDGTPYATIVIDGDEYKGVYTKQFIDGSNIETMCFTVVNEDGVCVWGSKAPSDAVVVAQTVKSDLVSVPKNTYADIELISEGLNGADISWTSSNPSVLSNDGTITRPEVDTVVTLTETVSKGNYYYEKTYQVTVKATPQSTTESTLIGSYFVNDPQDLSSRLDGSLAVDNPFYKYTNYGLDLTNGAKITFDVDCTGEVHTLGTILAFMANKGDGGRLYFTPGSYLGYNGTGGYFDANIYNFGLVKDYIGEVAAVSLAFSSKGFTVSINGETVYTEEILTTTNGAGSVTKYENVLKWLQNSANELYFGYGSWWSSAGYDEANATISNVYCYAGPSTGTVAKELDTVYDFTDEVVLETSKTISYEANPFYNKNIDSVFIEYTINFSDSAVKNGWDGLFSFYNSKTGGRVSVQSAPYICYNDGSGKWIDVNQPGVTGGTNAISEYGLVAGKDYKFSLLVTNNTLEIYLDGVKLETGENSSGATYEELIDFITECDQFTWGVGEAVTAYWWTELCTLKDITIGSKIPSASGASITESVELTTSAISYMDNPFYGSSLEQLYLEYTINWNPQAAKNGWDGLFSFYNTETEGRVSFQSAPYICYNDGSGSWMDLNQPGAAGGTNVAASLETGKDYRFSFEITKNEVNMYVDGVKITTAENGGNATYADILNYITKCDKLTLGVGEGKTAYWWTENCTLNKLSISPVQVTVTADENGTVNESKAGNQVTVSAIAFPGYELEGWYVNGVKRSSSSVYSFEICKNVSVSPVFVLSTIPQVSETPTPAVTPTPTSTPEAQVKIQVTSENNVSINQQYVISATGTQSIDLSKLTIFYYYSRTSTIGQNFWCDFAGLLLNASPWYINYTPNVKAAFHNGYVEISFTESYILEPNGGNLNMGVRFAQSDWSSYQEFVDYGCKVFYNGVQIG